MDVKLSWKGNVLHVSKKAAKVLNLSCCHMSNCNASAKQMAFRALVIPIVDYASTVWNPRTHKNSKALKTEVLSGFVVAGFVLSPTNGLNHQRNVVISCLGHHSLLDGSICH